MNYQLSPFQAVLAWTASALAGFAFFLLCAAWLGVLDPLIEWWFPIEIQATPPPQEPS
jgi:hypothetical protein